MLTSNFIHLSETRTECLQADQNNSRSWNRLLPWRQRRAGVESWTRPPWLRAVGRADGTRAPPPPKNSRRTAPEIKARIFFAVDFLREKRRSMEKRGKDPLDLVVRRLPPGDDGGIGMRRPRCILSSEEKYLPGQQREREGKKRRPRKEKRRLCVQVAGGVL